MFIPMALLFPAYLILKQDIHFNHQFSSVNAWSTKRRKAGHLYAIKIEICHKNNINVLSFHKLKIWDGYLWRDGKIKKNKNLG